MFGWNILCLQTIGINFQKISVYALFLIMMNLTMFLLF
jgi:hypothetical protein